MNIGKFLLLGSFVFPLAACDPSTVNVTTTPLNYQITQPAPIAGVNLNNVNFKVVTKTNVDEFVKNQIAAQGNSNPVFIAISTNDYKTLSLNMAELHRYILQQQQIIVYYKKEVNAVNSVGNNTTTNKK